MNNKEIDINHGDWLRSVRTKELQYRYRCGPVPNFARYEHYSLVRSRHRSYSRRPCGSFRYPHTLQSVKAYYRDQDESRYGDYFFKVRVRNNKDLPDAWDDDWVKRERCWKDFRKTQYK
jgi:hypothetical protein